MGEAKRRKESEPHFGSIPKTSPLRGLVISRPIEVEGNIVRFNGGLLDPQELRFALLLWDRLVLPETNAIGFPPDPDIDFIEATGVLRRAIYPIEGEVAAGTIRGHMGVFRELDNAEPGLWALAEGPRAFQWLTTEKTHTEGITLELHRAIPIPRHDVPLAEILEFRERRRDELLLLRSHLESFLAEVAKAADKEDALRRRLVEVDQACANLLQVGREWQFPVLISDLKTSFSFDLVKLVGGAIAGYVANNTLGVLGGATVALAGAALTGGASLSIKGDLALQSIKRPQNPYRYAYSMHEELR